MGPWASLPARGLRAPLRATAQHGHRSPGTFQLPPGPGQMLLPCVGLGQGRGPSSPHRAADPQRDRQVGWLPGPLSQPLSPEGKFVGPGCAHQEWPSLWGQAVEMNNGSRVCSTSRSSPRLAVYGALCTPRSSLWFATRRTVDKALWPDRVRSHPQLGSISPNPFLSTPQKPGEGDSCSLGRGGQTKAQRRWVAKKEPGAEVCSLNSLHVAASSCC